MSYDLLEAWEPIATGNFTTLGYGWSVNSTPAIVAGQQRSGTRCIEFNGVNERMSFPLNTGATEKVAGFAFKYTTALLATSISNPIVFFSFSSGNEIWLRINTAGQICIMNGAAEIAVGTQTLNIGVYYFIELYLNRITGDVRVYLNFDGVGAPVAEVSANVGAKTAFATVRFGPGAPSSTGSPTSYVDDIYVFSGSTVFGDSAVLYDFPVSNNAPQDWTPSSGNAWERIDNVPVDPAQYIEAVAAGDTSNFDFGGFLEIIYQVYAVGVMTNWLRTGATAETGRQGFNISGTDYYAPAITVPQTTAEWVRDIFELNPDTGVQWLPAEIQTGSIGSIDRVS